MASSQVIGGFLDVGSIATAAQAGALRREAFFIDFTRNLRATVIRRLRLKRELSNKSDNEFDACYIGSQIAGHMEMAATLKVLSGHVSGKLSDVVNVRHGPRLVSIWLTPKRSGRILINRMNTRRLPRIGAIGRANFNVTMEEAGSGGSTSCIRRSPAIDAY